MRQGTQHCGRRIYLGAGCFLRRVRRARAAAPAAGFGSRLDILSLFQLLLLPAIFVGELNVDLFINHTTPLQLKQRMVSFLKDGIG